MCSSEAAWSHKTAPSFDAAHEREALGITQITASQNQKEVTANAALIRAINATSAGRTVTLPSVERMSLLHNNAANTQSVDFIRGATTLTLTVGQTVIARLDGTANGLVSLLRGTG